MFNQINENIIRILGIDKLPEETQKKAMDEMGSIVYQEIMLRVLDLMTEEDKDEFEKLIETNPDPEILFTFLAEKVPTIGTIAAEEAENLHAETASIMSQIGK